MSASVYDGQYGKKEAGNAATSYGLVDNLTMDHNGNQLTWTGDAGVSVSLSESADFKDKSTTRETIEYTYNKNGALYSDLKAGKYTMSNADKATLNQARNTVNDETIQTGLSIAGSVSQNAINGAGKRDYSNITLPNDAIKNNTPNLPKFELKINNDKEGYNIFISGFH